MAQKWIVDLPEGQNRAPVFTAPNKTKLTPGLDPGEIVEQIGEISHDGVYYSHWRYPYGQVWTPLEYLKEYVPEPDPGEPPAEELVTFTAGTLTMINNETGEIFDLVNDAVFKKVATAG